MRYGDGEYFFIVDAQNNFVMHAAKPALEGKSGTELRDPNGKMIIQELVRVALGNERGGAVDYAFAKPGSDKAVPKVSYAAQFKPWGWVYSTGIYLDDVDQAFRSEAINSLLIIVLAIAFLAGVSVLIGRSVLRQLGGEPAEASAIALRIAGGDLGQDMRADQSASGSLMHSMAEMQNRLRGIFSSIDRLAATLVSSAGEISVATDEVRRAAEEQANSTAATAASIEELTVSINEVAQNARATGDSSTAAANTAEQGQALVHARLTRSRRFPKSSPDRRHRSGNWPPLPTILAELPTSSRKSPSRPICWRSTPPSKRLAPASRVAVSRSSPTKSASLPSGPARPPGEIGEWWSAFKPIPIRRSSPWKRPCHRSPEVLTRRAKRQPARIEPPPGAGIERARAAGGDGHARTGQRGRRHRQAYPAHRVDDRGNQRNGTKQRRRGCRA
jgi:hypothetical protein